MRSTAVVLVIGVVWLVGGQAVCAAEPVTTAPSAENAATNRERQVAVEQASETAPRHGADQARNEALPVYTPPRRGAPRTRVGGGTRQLSDDVALMVLSPPHTGLTRQAQPTLYWFLSAAHAGPFEFVVTTRDASSPLWRKRVDGPLAAGIHTLSLRESDVALTAGVEYQWSVAIIRDPERRSRDLVTIGTLQRVADATQRVEDTTQRAQDATPPAEGADAVRVLAERGFWYDALQRLGELGERSGNDAKVRDYCAALLDQAELAQIADYVRNHESSTLRASC